MRKEEQYSRNISSSRRKVIKEEGNGNAEGDEEREGRTMTDGKDNSVYKTYKELETRLLSACMCPCACRDRNNRCLCVYLIAAGAVAAV